LVLRAGDHTRIIAHPGDLPDDMLAYVKRDDLMHLIKGQQYILHEMLVGQREVDQEEFVWASKSHAALFSMIPSTLITLIKKKYPAAAGYFRTKIE